MDSTGLKTDEEGEWFRHKHGKHEKRGWIELHVGIDYKSEQIVAGWETHNKYVASKPLYRSA